MNNNKLLAITVLKLLILHSMIVGFLALQNSSKACLYEKAFATYLKCINFAVLCFYSVYSTHPNCENVQSIYMV